jgi:2-polyprenyl-3-methyl-5-hydroxy-6-metoxy-1,4-benzoquinol methylase
VSYRPADYWDALAPHHASLENNYFDLTGLRRIVHDIHEPVLVVGAGQGVIVEELLKNGFQTDGVDLSSEMIRYAKRRRGLTLIEADAKALPFGEGTYETIIYATGVVDFMGDEEQIGVILNEAMRTASQSGKIFVAFYKMSAASEEFLTTLGLLRNNVLSLRETLEIYRMKPAQTIAWVAKKAEIGFLRAGILLLRAWVLSTMKEKRAGFNMQRIFRTRDHASSLINTAPERQPYRNEPEIRNLFKRLAIPLKTLEEASSCYIVQI